jgi:uncharacterized membrane protein YkvA (DUF1232 family)
MEALYPNKETNMADKKNRDLMVSPQRGMIHDLVIRAKLIIRLIGDKRVSFWAKLIPIGMVIYVLSPIDVIMGIPGLDALDDAAVIGLGSYIFLEFCPPDVVKEHMKALTSNMDEAEGDVVDAETTEVKEENK